MSKPEGYYVDDIGSKPPRRERGCFFYGCLFSAILAGIAAIFLVVVLVIAWRFTARTVAQYTDTTPMPMPATTLTKEETDAVVARAKGFQEAVEQGHAATLTLTGAELNALVNSHPNAAGRAAVDIVGDELRGQVSIPWDFPFMGRRYLNGKAALRASIDDDELVVNVLSLEVRGKPLPKKIMDELSDENLAEDIRTDPETSKVLRRIESLTIQDGTITIQSRERKTAEAEEQDEAPAKEDDPGPDPEPKADSTSEAPPGP